ncbi:MAG: hypothetical protein U5K54_13900 [Cytophagales bacterium]|nr:hypothetical protein [Cytophagales bacterium]
MPAAPYKLVNNDYSLLDMADLVMMDPVGTGSSVPVGKAKVRRFSGVWIRISAALLYLSDSICH